MEERFDRSRARLSSVSSAISADCNVYNWDGRNQFLCRHMSGRKRKSATVIGRLSRASRASRAYSQGSRLSAVRRRAYQSGGARFPADKPSYTNEISVNECFL